MKKSTVITYTTSKGNVRRYRLRKILKGFSNQKQKALGQVGIVAQLDTGEIRSFRYDRVNRCNMKIWSQIAAFNVRKFMSKQQEFRGI